jgi:hypothetical protein
MSETNLPRQKGEASIWGVTVSQQAPQSSMSRENMRGLSQSSPVLQVTP